MKSSDSERPSRFRVFLDNLLAGAALTAGIGDRPRRLPGRVGRRTKLKGWQRENKRRGNRWA